ncbi:DNA cytosine methyltransferase [Deinococcus psychrotolerans]|uniref:DNA (cytosine-5-)-methyltransferase n=1 Tax=Deinococcus psychrotolerans TaxID=2489213 RepID=A0A3G8YKM6_9DEIO|nr:DNA cytosine methyltransferase [Deinococcus psychrotolerans]AZI41626.1 DNA cytosine methyltransferase [Deinococcus psychrotolerans]
MKDALTHISLFSGAMGLDLGLAAAGFDTLTAVELDRAARATIRQNTQAALPVFSDIQQVSAGDLLSATGLQRGEVTLVSGGPPCQPFSTAGRREALNDPRGSLFRDYLRLVNDLQPRFFVMENVRGLLSATLQHRPISERGPASKTLSPEEQRGSAFEVILSEFQRIGYSFVYGLLNAADYGVPQSRQRVILLGSRDHEALALPPATHAQHGGSLPRWRTLRDALSNLDDPHPHFQPYSEARLQYLRLVPEGGNWRSLPPELQQAAMGGAYHSGGGKVGFYRRLSWDKPAPTVTTSPAQKATDMCHPTEHRPISVREAARLQGFPDEWLFCGSLSDQYRQIGNAVPVGLGLAIGRQFVGGAEREQGSQLSSQQPRLFEVPA